MHLAPIALFLLTSVAVVIAPLPKAPTCPPLDKHPLDPGTVEYHCNQIATLDERINKTQGMIETKYRNQYRENLRLLKEFRKQHEDARNKSAKAIAEVDIPFFRPFSRSPQDQVNHHSEQIRSHQAAISLDKAKLSITPGRPTEVDTANSRARVGVREARIVSHAKSVMELKDDNPHLDIPHDIPHLAAQGGQPHPNNPYQSTSFPLPHPGSHSQFGVHPPQGLPFRQQDLSHRPPPQSGSYPPPHPPSLSGPGSSSSQGGGHGLPRMADLLNEPGSPPFQGGGFEPNRGGGVGESSGSYYQSPSRLSGSFPQPLQGDGREPNRGGGVGEPSGSYYQSPSPRSGSFPQPPQGGGGEPKRGPSVANLLNDEPEGGKKKQRRLR